jgi:5-methylcytosine-specific restriction endonuclease McrA
MNIHQLREAYKDKDFIPYSELLKTDEWKQKRVEILKRDDFKCTTCGQGGTIEHYSQETKKITYYWFDHSHWAVNEWGEKEPVIYPVKVDKPCHLEIHHHFYVINRLPWEYDNSDLTTLCNLCHDDFHNENNVTIYSEDMLNELEGTPCHRCNGVGRIPKFSKIRGGICFNCEGARFVELIKRK